MSDFFFKTELNDEAELNIARSKEGEIIFDVTSRSFNNLNVADAVEIADALYAAAGEDDIRRASIKEEAAVKASERSYGDLFEEANRRFVKANMEAKRGLKNDNQAAVVEVFTGLLPLIIASGNGKAILKALLG